MEMRSVFNSSIKDVDSVCVAISRPKKHRKQQHIGLLYLDRYSSAKLLHLAWHYDLRKESPSDKYLWQSVSLDKDNMVHLATICELIYETNKERIPYGLSIEGTGFAEDGTFLPEEHCAGLTCATFVIQVFHSQGFMIIDLDAWKHKAPDKVWQRQIAKALRSRGASKKHMDYQQKKIQEGAARFKPEEVVVAAVMSNPPYGAKAVKADASRVLDLVIKHSQNFP